LALAKKLLTASISLIYTSITVIVLSVKEHYRLGDDAKRYGKELRVTFGRALRRQRRDLDLPQQAIADRSGLSKRAVCQVERASVDTHLGTLAALALAVGLDVPSMLRGRPAADPEPAGSR
jgi:hypothetical protein